MKELSSGLNNDIKTFTEVTTATLKLNDLSAVATDVVMHLYKEQTVLVQNNHTEYTDSLINRPCDHRCIVGYIQGHWNYS